MTRALNRINNLLRCRVTRQIEIGLELLTELRIVVQVVQKLAVSRCFQYIDGQQRIRNEPLKRARLDRPVGVNSRVVYDVAAAAARFMAKRLNGVELSIISEHHR